MQLGDENPGPAGEGEIAALLREVKITLKNTSGRVSTRRHKPTDVATNDLRRGKTKMSQLFVQDKDVVVPGEPLAAGMDYLPGPGAYRKGDQVIANRVGLVSINGRAVKLIPLSGPYVPKRDDVIICKVIDITLNGWRLDTNTPSSAMLSVRDATNTFITKGSDLTKILQIGDYIVAGVIQVTTQKLVDVTLRGPGLRKLPSGQLLKFSPNKFPRLIGRQGSMVSMIKRATNCQIVVGQNGLIWMDGEPAMEVIAVEAIRLIEENAHTSGLTDRVKKFLESKGLTVPENVGPDDQPRMESFSREGGFGDRPQRSFDGEGSDNGDAQPQSDFGSDRPREGGERRFDGERRGGFGHGGDRGGRFGGRGGDRGGFGGERREGGFNREGGFRDGNRDGNREGGERRFEGERRFGGDRNGGNGGRFDRPRFSRDGPRDGPRDAPRDGPRPEGFDNSSNSSNHNGNSESAPANNGGSDESQQ